MTPPDASRRLERAIRTLDGLVNWERRDRQAGMRLGLESMRDLAQRLGDPHRSWPAVHVAGTKGKGSVASLIAAGLARAGLRVGTYASPHVERMHERIRLQGRDVSDDLLADGLERALAAREAALHERSAGSDATWFDLVTAAAFWIFAHEAVDFGIVEVGLGGRLDSTNIIDGEVCVITGIELEHTAVLGATRAAIASEKAGILRAGATFVCGEPASAGRPTADDAHAVLLGRARELGLAVVTPPSGSAATPSAQNLALARAALDALGARGRRGKDGTQLAGTLLDEAAIAGARLPGRMERFELEGVPIVLDGAHVPRSVELVLRELAATPTPTGAPVAVLSLARDKDAEGILKALAGRVDRLICTSVETGLHLDAGDLAETAGRAGLEAEAIANPGDAVRRAVHLAAGGRWVLVIGSLYLAGAVRALLAR